MKRKRLFARNIAMLMTLCMIISLLASPWGSGRTAYGAGTEVQPSVPSSAWVSESVKPTKEPKPSKSPKPTKTPKPTKSPTPTPAPSGTSSPQPEPSESPAFETGSVTGTVYGTDNNPLASVAVAVTGTGYRTVTDSEGRFTIQNVSVGSYTLTATKPGFLTGVSVDFEVTNGGTATVSFTLVVEQLLLNGGFENMSGGIASDWSPIKNGWGSYIEAASEAVRTGSYGMMIQTSESNNPWIMQVIPVEEGAAYELVSWFKAIGVTGNPGYKIEYYSNRESTVENWVSGYDNKAPSSQNDGEWHELKHEIRVPPKAKYMYVYLRLYGQGKVYFDDASVVKTQNPPQLVNMETNQIYYYPDVTTAAVRAKLRPEDGIFADKTVDMRIAAKGAEGVVFEQTGIPAAAEMEVSFDPTVMDLKQPYLLTVQLKDAALQTVDQLEKTMYRWPRPATIPENGPVYVDGQPFFPVIAYHAGFADFPYMKDIGVNTVQGRFASSADDMKLQLDTAQQHGLKMLVPLYMGMKVKENFEQMHQFVTQFKSHPAVLAWMIMDEPALHGIPQEELLDAYKLIRTIDPDHPTYMVDYDFGAFRWVGQATDVLVTDVYPYKSDFMQPISVVGSSVRQAIADVDGVKPVWTVLQTFRVPNSVYNYLPTIDQVRNMAYQSFLAGSKGLGYYSINDPNWKLQDSELWPGLVRFKEELKLIGDLVSGGTKLQENIGNEVQWGVWEHGQERYAVAINLTKQNQTTVLPLGLHGYEVQLLYGDSTRKWESWEHDQAVALAPEQTLVYRIVPFTASVDAAMEEMQDAMDLIPNTDWRAMSEPLVEQLQELKQVWNSENDMMTRALGKAVLFMRDLGTLKEWVEQQEDSVLEGKKTQLLDSLNKAGSHIQPIVQSILQTDMQFVPGQAIPGEELEVAVQFRNTSDKAMQGAVLQIALPDAAAVPPIVVNIGNVDSGESHASNHSIEIPMELEPGVYPVTASVYFQYNGKLAKVSDTRPLQVNPLLEAALCPKSMNLRQYGTYPVAFELKNNSSQALSVELSHASPEGIMVNLPSSVNLTANETKSVAGSITIPHSVTEGVYRLNFDAKIGNKVLVSVPLSISVDTNLAYNGGFEKQAAGTEKPEGWYTGPNAWDRSVAHSGQASVRLDPDPANAWNTISTDNRWSMPITAGKEYVLSGWVKNSSLAGAVELGIRQADGNGVTVGSYTWTKTNNHSDWMRYEVTFVASPQTKTVQAYFKANQAVDGPAWVDDLQVHEKLLSSSIEPAGMRVKPGASYPFAIGLANNTNQEMTVKLLPMSVEGITIDTPSEIVMGAFESRTVQGTVTLASSVAEGQYAVTIQPIVGETLYTMLPLTVNVNANMLENPGFENLNGGKPVNWNLYFVSGTTLTATSESARTGSYGMRLRTQQSNNGVLVDQKILVEAGKTYEVSAWVRSNDLEGQGFRLYSEFFNDSTAHVGTVLGDFHKTAPGEWEKVTFQVTAPPGAKTTIVYFRLYGFGDATHADQVDLDDVSVIEVVE